MPDVNPAAALQGQAKDHPAQDRLRLTEIFN
jgi:hypothetical protein